MLLDVVATLGGALSGTLGGAACATLRTDAAGREEVVDPAIIAAKSRMARMCWNLAVVVAGTVGQGSEGRLLRHRALHRVAILLIRGNVTDRGAMCQQNKTV